MAKKVTGINMDFIIYSNSICVFIVAILLLGMNLRDEKREETAERFTILLISIIAFLIVNIVCEVFEGDANNTPFLFIVNMLAFLAVDVIELSFVGYLHSLIMISSGKNEKLLSVVVYSTIFRILTIIVLTVSKKLFLIRDGHYVEASLNSIPYILSGIIMLELIAIIIINRKCFRSREFIVILAYVILPVPAIIVEMYTGYYSLTPVAITLSVLLIYVLIQAVAIEQGRIRETVLEELSVTDLLTKMSNRRAYYNFISGIDKDRDIGVFFCDINGLKKTNDLYGHAAGDELIKNFAGLISNSFRENSSFRISGDEFVIVVEDISRSDFDHRVEFFKALIRDNSSIAAVGYAHGKGEQIQSLVTEAEDLMYEDKENYHR